MTKDVVIGDKEELTEIEIEFKGPVKAIVINHGDEAYAKVRYDAKTLQTFEKEFYKIDEYLERGVIGYQLWLHVIDGKMSSLQYF